MRPYASQQLKDFARATLRHAGWEVKRVRKNPKPDALAALIWLADQSEVSTVLDVGAHDGGFAAGLRARGYDGRIASFEPRNDAYRLLEHRSRADPLWTTSPVAAGDRSGTITINVASNQVSSSLLAMEADHVGSEPSSAYVGTEQVRQERLDEVIGHLAGPREVLAIKLDVQGYEAAALRGASALLERTTVIHIELSLAPLYIGQPDWRELTDELLGVGFQLYHLEPVFSDGITARTLQVDAVFWRDRLRA